MAVEIKIDTFNGATCPDGHAKEYAEKMVDTINNNPDKVGLITCGSEVIFAWFRVFVKEGKVSRDDFFITYNGENILINKFGRLNQWPEGMLDQHENALLELIQ